MPPLHCAPYSGVYRGDAELVDELLQARVVRRGEPQLEPPGRHHDRCQESRVRGEVDVAGTGHPTGDRTLCRPASDFSWLTWACGSPGR